MTIVYAHCPACGGPDLFTQQVPDPDGEIGDYAVLRCWREECPDPDAASKILEDKEIHHIVSFDERGFFNVKHPLRERINNQLLDCEIHDVICAECEGYGMPGKGSWRLRHRDEVPGEESNEWPWLWERV